MNIQVRANPEAHKGSGDDPKLLDPNKTYNVIEFEVHSWHTLVRIEGFEDKQFNSVIFTGIDDKYDVAFEGACMQWRSNGGY